MHVGEWDHIELTVYSELLRMALEDEDHELSDVARLVAEILRCRSEFGNAVRVHPADPSTELGYALAYDAALVRLCRELRLEEALTAGVAVAFARKQAEERIVERLPSISAALSDPVT